MSIEKLKVPTLLLLGVVIGWALSLLTGPATGSELDRDDVLAVVGSTELTRADIEDTAPEKFVALTRQRHLLTEETLEQAIRLKLVEVEAAARGIPPGQLVDEEVYSQVPEPTTEEVHTALRRNGAVGDLASLESQMRRAMKAQAQSVRYEEFLAQLRERHRVAVRFEPPRSRIETRGYPAKGAPDAAVTVVEFSDFQCPYCREFVNTMDQVLDTYGDHVRFVYRHLPLTSIHPGADRAAEASMCAHDQDKFWEVHDELFANPRAHQPELLKQIARNVGLDSERFDECFDSRKHRELVAGDADQARRLGVAGTPGVFVNGRYLADTSPDGLVDMILDELQRAGTPVERRRLEPVRIQVAADGHPAIGSADAPVTIVEFADFQCPFCKQAVGPFEEIRKAYGDQVRFVFRQFPIEALHPEAPKAAEASLCAAAQNRFWEMHDALYENAESLPVPRLKEIARGIGMNGAQFDTCLDAGVMAAQVASDIEAGRSAGVSGTPATFINGRKLTGFQRFEAMAAVIEDELARLRN